MSLARSTIVVGSVLLLFLLLPSASPSYVAVSSAPKSTLTDPAPAIIEFDLPSSNAGVGNVVVSGSGTVWMSEQIANKIAGFFPSNQSFVEYSIPTADSHPQGLAVTADGSVWFAELAGSKIGRLDPRTGAITEYRIPTPNVAPIGLAADSYSNVWFAELFGNQIGELNPKDGSIREYPLPIHFSGPNQLAFDASGKLWFSGTDADTIGYLVPADTTPGTSSGIVEFIPESPTYTLNVAAANGQNVSTSIVDPVGITVAPDGNVWFAEHGESSFDEYLPSNGTLQKFWTSRTPPGIVPPYSYPNGIAVDVSGNVWVSEHLGNKIARFDPQTQKLTEFNIPCCGKSQVAGAFWLALGPDGKVWFTESAGNKVGVIQNRTLDSGVLLSSSENYVTVARGSNVSVPLTVESRDKEIVNGTFDISGTSPSGSLENVVAFFRNATLSIPQNASVSSSVVLKVGSLPYGVNDLTVGFHYENFTESTIIHLKVTGQNTVLNLTVATIIAVILAIGAGVGGALYARGTNKAAKLVRKRRGM